MDFPASAGLSKRSDLLKNSRPKNPSLCRGLVKKYRWTIVEKTFTSGVQPVGVKGELEVERT